MVLAKPAGPLTLSALSPGTPPVVKTTEFTLASLLAVFLTGCATNDISARIREKSSVYATLPPVQQEKINQGIIALGFTGDMVYMAMGPPSQVEPVEKTGGHAELWTYRNYYPQLDAAHMKYADYRTESPYQPARTSGGTNVPVSTSRTRSATSTTGPQGGSMEPADLPTYTLRILFQDGKVKRLGIGQD
jgi:hypothetical protein